MLFSDDDYNIIYRSTVQGKVREIQGQGKVREFCNWSGKVGILRKVREIKEKWRVNQGNLTFSCLIKSKLQYNHMTCKIRVLVRLMIVIRSYPLM